MELNDEQLERYSRHIILKDLGVEGQIKILESKVLIIGAGGLGAPAALYLSAAGIGTIGIVDFDRVDLSNLQRQIIHSTNDIGRLKVDSAKNKMLAINPDIQVKTYNLLVNSSNIRSIIRDYDFIIDGTDNFAAKFLINDACFLEKKPYSHGGILRFEGQSMTILPGESACYRCIFKTPPPRDAVPTCSQAGVLGAIAGMLGTIQAAEVIKYCTGAGELLVNQLLVFDAKTMNFRKVKLNKNKNCGLCGENPSIVRLMDEDPPVCELKK